MLLNNLIKDFKDIRLIYY